jgi:hypothetical protein
MLQYFVFAAAYVENPTSHSCIVGKGKSLSATDLDSSEYFGGDCIRIQSVVPD